jgi:type IV pilus assembly protein PilM
MSSKLKRGNKPKLACEVSAERVLAGRVADNGQIVSACAVKDLAPGSVLPDLIEANLPERMKVSQAIQDALGDVAERSRDVIAVLPDAAVRVALLDFDTLPEDGKEAEAILRFRLKKSLPFDVDKAKISYHPQISGQGVKVIAAVALASVVEEYEAAFKDAGYNPGVVLPSMLAALGAADSDRPTLVVKVDAHTTSIAILDKDKMLLFRTLENARGAAISGEQLAEEVYPSIVFFQDTYQMNIEQVFIAGLPESEGAIPALRAQTGSEVRDLVGTSHLGASTGTPVPRWKMAGVVGALLS